MNLNIIQITDLPDPEFDIYNAALTATNNTDQLTNSAIPVPRSNETVPVLEPPVIPSSSIASTAENSAETSRTEARSQNHTYRNLMQTWWDQQEIRIHGNMKLFQI